MYGWMGTILKVDLSSGNVEKQPLDSGIAMNYLGGRGLNGITLFNEVGPDTDPLSPENVLLFGVGPCNGTLSIGSGRCTVTSKSPLTGIYGDANFGGAWGPELKYAGYDQLVIKGKAAEPVYLWIDDDQVEIKSAKNLWGKTTSETDELIKSEIGDPNIHIVYIGPAGERLIKFANVMSDLYRAAGRTGMGCVMGSKNLKAIAVRGSNGVKVAEPSTLQEVVLKSYEILRNDVIARNWAEQGTLALIEKYNMLGTMSGNNFQVPVINTENYNGKYFDEKYKVKNRACFGCPLHCGCYFSLKDGPYAGLNWGKIEYGSIDGFVTRIGVDDIEFGVAACHYADQQGIDAITLGAVLSFAFECYEKGILTNKETDNLSLDWGNKNSAMALMKMVVNREGLGDILAQGSDKASEIIGQESHKYALTTKGLDHVEADPRGLNAWGLGYAVSTRGADHLRALAAFEMSITPERAKELFGSEEAGDRFATSGKAAMVKWYEELRAFEDSMEICKFVARTELNFPGPLAEIYGAVTGVVLTPEEVLLTGERIINVEKAFNTREGLTRKDDSLPERFLKEPLPSGSAKGSVCKLEPMLDDYYYIRGWDVESGLQTRQILKKLGLEQIAEELEKAGLLR